MSLRRAVGPLEVPLQKLTERQIDVVPGCHALYFRDVLDHAIRVRDQVSALDELLSSILQASSPARRWRTTRTCARSRPRPA